MDQDQRLPRWAGEVLAAPGGGPLQDVSGSELIGADGVAVGRIDAGIARFAIERPDSSISFYRKVGGARFHERRSVAYAMTTLDTSVYHGYLRDLRPRTKTGLIVDVGGGDGRNALPWLEWGYNRVVVVDPAFDALARLRSRVAENNPEWLERLVLIEADARMLPLTSGCATLVQTIEALAYLNEDYAQGLAECVRILGPGETLFLADRDCEAGLLTRLFYGGGIGPMLSQSADRDIWDGNAENVVRSRCFTAPELREIVIGAGIEILSEAGISGLSLLLGYERSNGRIQAEDERHLDAVHALLARLGREGGFRRSHVIVGRRTQ